MVFFTATFFGFTTADLAFGEDLTAALTTGLAAAAAGFFAATFLVTPTDFFTAGVFAGEAAAGLFVTFLVCKKDEKNPDLPIGKTNSF